MNEPMLTAQMSDNLPEASLPNYLSNDWCKIFQNGTYMCDQWCTKTEVKKRFRFQKLFSWTIPGFCIVIALMYMPLPEAENVTDIEGYNFFCFVGKLPAQLVSQTSFFFAPRSIGGESLLEKSIAPVCYIHSFIRGCSSYI